jgi:hypothetical protein
MGDLLGSWFRGAKSGQYCVCVIWGGVLHSIYVVLNFFYMLCFLFLKLTNYDLIFNNFF